ncbi:low-density lipoprotein receptor-related protein 2-like [Bolinopsis microptera]|uniref:low-density lipoprotein receptor-related protein 2-like n=1 Tax=Bolinopsis microptera TaxID=2820187 RepID=UPI00307954AF
MKKSVNDFSSVSLFPDDNSKQQTCQNPEKEGKVSNEDCTVSKIGGFLKRVCYKEKENWYYHKCANSDINYEQGGTLNMITGSYTISSVSTLCEDDPYAYQACGFNSKTTTGSHAFLCGGYFSYDSEQGVAHFQKCDLDCENSGIRDLTSQPTAVTLTVFSLSARFSELSVCDDKCDSEKCVDESICNGYTYGLYCPGRYVPPNWICDGQKDCENGEDESNCDIIDKTKQTCIKFKTDQIAPLPTHIRCSVFKFDQYMDTFPYCSNFQDQTNCSDVGRIGGYCYVNGFWSSVSKYVVCDSALMQGQIVSLCDDYLDGECLSAPGKSTNCIIHKHKLCDGVIDCGDSSDEIADTCKITTGEYFQCYRSFNPAKLMEIPFSWILDNQVDCTNGQDEQTFGLIKECGVNETFRMVYGKRTCPDVFLCPGDVNGNNLVEFDLLCDGVPSCEVEEQVCALSRDFPRITKTAEVGNCSVRDLCTIVERPKNTGCQIKNFGGPSEDVFGVEIMLNVPVAKVNCSRLFGEYYVFLSCMGLCLNSTCPLDARPLEHNICPYSFSDRVYTLAKNSYLTFVTMTEEGKYENTHFQCKNKRCVTYNQVCDLVDDCGDMSDEQACTNHMVCKNTQDKINVKEHLIAPSQKCDGIFDCFDLSDECNESCGKEILESWYLKLTCWILGISAAVLNIITTIKTASSIKDSGTGNMVSTRILVCLIGFGDFLIGVYLIVLSVFDSFIHGKDYCRRQPEWLSGYTCALLGVISTIGSQLSLFAMTSLSLIRVSGIVNSSLSAPKRVNKRLMLKIGLIVLAVVTSALAVALTPLVPAFEDYFVQGMFYDPEYKIFIGFPNKVKHLEILGAYCKNESFSPDMSWSEIGSKVDNMFSKDYGSMSRSAVHFYGNDGVCLFKYFVRSDDPRRSRGADDTSVIDDKENVMVWLMLGTTTSKSYSVAVPSWSKSTVSRLFCSPSSPIGRFMRNDCLEVDLLENVGDPCEFMVTGPGLVLVLVLRGEE